MGRPGLDPGTLGLKEGNGWSESSGGVGIIRELKKSCPVVSDLSGGVGMVRGKLRGILSDQYRPALGFASGLRIHKYVALHQSNLVKRHNEQ